MKSLVLAVVVVIGLAVPVEAEVGSGVATQSNSTVSLECDGLKDPYCRDRQHAQRLEARWMELGAELDLMPTASCSVRVETIRQTRQAAKENFKAWELYDAKWRIVARGQVRHFKRAADQQRKLERRLADSYEEAHEQYVELLSRRLTLSRNGSTDSPEVKNLDRLLEVYREKRENLLQARSNAREGEVISRDGIADGESQAAQIEAHLQALELAREDWDHHYAKRLREERFRCNSRR